MILPAPDPELPREGRVIPVAAPRLEGNELRYVTDCIKRNWISSKGEYVRKFEEAFARCVGAKYAVSCTSGTTALHLALATLGLGPGDEVIIPTFTMIATANAVTYTGAKPVLVDSELRTWNIDARQIEDKITPRTKALMPVHTYGHPADMEIILELARQHGLYVIEDAAEAQGAEYKERKIGSIGDLACFSFYGNKIITTGEGGMVTTNNPELAERAFLLKEHAFSPERHFWHQHLGFNYRMTNLQAAVGLAQVERFEEHVEIRRRHAALYNSLLKDIPGLVLPPEAMGVKNVYWMYSVLVTDEFGLTRDELRQRLARKGIETRCFFIPIHVQPIYRGKYDEPFPVAEYLCERGMNLPSGATLSEEDIHYIARCIAECQKRRT